MYTEENINVLFYFLYNFNQDVSVSLSSAKAALLQLSKVFESWIPLKN